MTIPRKIIPGLLAFFLCWESAASDRAAGGLTVLTLDSTPGRELFAVYDEFAGMITLAEGLSSPAPEYRYVPVRRHGYFDGKFLRADDLKGDGGLDLLLPAYSANRLLILWGDTFSSQEPRFEEVFVGPGPLAVATVQLDSSAGREVLVATGAGSGITVRGWDPVEKEAVTEPASFPNGFATEGLLGFESAAPAGLRTGPVLAILRKDERGGANPVFEIFARNPAPEFGPANSLRRLDLARPYTDLAAGYPLGERQAGWFLAWGPELSTIVLIPSDSPPIRAAATAAEGETITFETPVRHVKFLPEQEDEVLVIFMNGSAELFSFTPGDGLTSIQSFTPDDGLNFLGAATANDQLLLLAGEPGSQQIKQFNSYEHDGAEYQLTLRGDWPAAPASETGVTVILYTGNPFSIPAPFPFETFVAGDWASMVSFANGEVSALVETFGGPQQGLANPMLQTLDPAVDPGAGGAALGNQWEPSSSLFHAGAVMADGIASVTISPAPGSYANTIGVTFQAGPGVTVHYRVNQNPWQSGLGPVWLTQDATVEYYGEHESGAVGSIHSAVYEIDQSFGIDSDGDSVPDAIEALAGSDPFLPDSDGDGIDDFSEIIEGSDPADPESQSEQIDGAAWSGSRILWDSPDSPALPAQIQDLRVADLFNRDEGLAMRGRGEVPEWNKDLELRSQSHILKFWLPGNHLIQGVRSPEPLGPALTGLAALPPAGRLNLPLDLEVADPLAAWRAAARDALERDREETLEFTAGPASTVAAILFEHWQATRLIELSRLDSLADRPRLADPPSSLRAGIPAPGDLAAIEHPQGNGLIAHELSHVVQQINSAVLDGMAYEPLRQTAQAFYNQAIEARRDRRHIAPPINALRDLISGDAPVTGYVLPQPREDLVALRDQLLQSIEPRPVTQAEGSLEYIHPEQTQFARPALALASRGQRFLLLDASRQPYHLPGAGSAIQGSTASLTAFALPDPAPEGFDGLLEVVSLSISAIPATTDTDENRNGLPDSWELAFLGSLNFDASDDLDGDGFVLGEEYLGGADPADPLSVPPGSPAGPGLSVVLESPAIARIQWEGSSAATYELWMSTDLTTWEPFPATVERDGDRNHFVRIELDQGSAFFRVAITFDSPGQ